MDNIKIYQDGDDVLIKISGKNATEILKDFLKCSLKEVSLSPVPPEPDEPVPDVDETAVDITPSFLTDIIETDETDDANVVLTFGKMAGKTIGEIANADIQYLNWILDNYHPKAPEKIAQYESVKRFLAKK